MGGWGLVRGRRGEEKRRKSCMCGGINQSYVHTWYVLIIDE